MGVSLRGSAVLGPSDQLQLQGLLCSLPLLFVAIVGLLVWEMQLHWCPVGAMESNKPDSQCVVTSTFWDPFEVLLKRDVIK